MATKIERVIKTAEVDRESLARGQLVAVAAGIVPKVIVTRRAMLVGDRLPGVRREQLYGPCPCGSGKKFKFCCLRSE